MFLFKFGDFSDAAGMASTLKRRFEENADHFVGGFGIGVTGADGDDIRVVVGAGEANFIRVEGDGGADAVDFISGDGHADAGGADQNASLGGARDHAMGNGSGVIRIVGRFSRMGAGVDDFVAGLTQRVADDGPLKRSPRDLRRSQFSWGNLTLAGLGTGRHRTIGSVLKVRWR